MWRRPSLSREDLATVHSRPKRDRHHIIAVTYIECYLELAQTRGHMEPLGVNEVKTSEATK